MKKTQGWEVQRTFAVGLGQWYVLNVIGARGAGVVTVKHTRAHTLVCMTCGGCDTFGRIPKYFGCEHTQVVVKYWEWHGLPNGTTEADAAEFLSVRIGDPDDEGQEQPRMHPTVALDTPRA